MRFLSLFAGIGGMDLGLERAGWECVGQVEVDPYCRAVLARHWPHVWQWGDIRLLDATTVRERCGRIDAVVAAPPCQPVSVAGKRKGVGDRRWLWGEFLRLVSDLRPAWLLAENVPGLRTRGADLVLGELEEAGYTCWPLVVGADHVGASHLRRRVWIVGHATESRRPVGEAAHRTGTEGGTAVERTGVVSDADGTGRERQWGDVSADLRSDALRVDWRIQPGRRCGTCGADTPLAAAVGPHQHDWEPSRTEPRVGGRIHGVSGRLAALKALGNAVVPQCAEALGRAMLDVA